MSGIPGDIAKTAHKITEEHATWLLLDERKVLSEAIANALAVERQRASDAAMHWATRIAEAGKIPDGWKLVPIEPTEAMTKAFFQGEASVAEVWCAMLDEAPSPPAERDAIDA